MARKYHIFDWRTHEELRECTNCERWSPLTNYHWLTKNWCNVCKPCARDVARERARAHKEQHRECARAYAKANPERVRARMSAWRIANKEKLHAYNTSPAKRAYSREYMRRKIGSPELRAYQREYDRRTGKGAEKRARRRAAEMGAVLEPLDRYAIIKRDGRNCYICQIAIKWRQITLDHVVPLARGGSHTAGNLRVCCRRCNFRKQDRTLDEYRAYLAECGETI